MCKSAVESSKGQFSTSLIPPSNVSNGTFPNFGSDFQFTSSAWPEVGDKSGRHGGGDSRSDHWRDQSKVNPCNGLVQSNTWKSVEPYFPSNGGECEEGLSTTFRPDLASDAKSMVVVLD